MAKRRNTRKPIKYSTNEEFERRIMRRIKIESYFLLFLTITMLSCTPIRGGDEFVVGIEYAQKKDYKNAIQKFSDAIEKDPNYWRFYIFRGVAYERINETDLAISDLTKGLDLLSKENTWYKKISNDELASFYMRRGKLYHKKRFYALAIKDYSKALELNRSVKEAYLKRAQAYRQINQLDLALADSNKAIEQSDDWMAFLSRGISHFRLANFDLAISDFDKSIKMNPSQVAAYLYRASATHLTSCDLKKILEDYFYVSSNENIDSDTLAIVYNQIAWILATASDDNIRNGNLALAYSIKAVEIASNCINLDTLAVTFAENDQFKDAISTHRQAIDKCRLNSPELVPQVENHLQNYTLKKKFRFECPGAENERIEFFKWQNQESIEAR